MIQRLADQFTLEYTNATGQQITVSMSDPDYMRVLGILEQQQRSIHDNNQAVSGYIGALADYQAWLNNDRQGATQLAPIKPLKVTIDDMGTVTKTPFVPALPDPVQPTFIRSTGSIKADVAPPDRLDLVLRVLQSILADIQILKAKGA